eukprot:scaffold55069_cov69-Phaeocystis_antarctica.AAC.8
MPPACCLLRLSSLRGSDACMLIDALRLPCLASALPSPSSSLSARLGPSSTLSIWMMLSRARLPRSRAMPLGAGAGAGTGAASGACTLSFPNTESRRRTGACCEAPSSLSACLRASCAALAAASLACFGPRASRPVQPASRAALAVKITAVGLPPLPPRRLPRGALGSARDDRDADVGDAPLSLAKDPATAPESFPRHREEASGKSHASSTRSSLSIPVKDSLADSRLVRGRLSTPAPVSIGGSTPVVRWYLFAETHSCAYEGRPQTTPARACAPRKYREHASLASENSCCGPQLQPANNYFWGGNAPKYGATRACRDPQLAKSTCPQTLPPLAYLVGTRSGAEKFGALRWECKPLSSSRRWSISQSSLRSPCCSRGAVSMVTRIPARF